MKNKAKFNGGQTVYTVNNKTNEVDEWIVSGIIPEKNLYILSRGNFQCVLPGRCIFEDKNRALSVANS